MCRFEYCLPAGPKGSRKLIECALDDQAPDRTLRDMICRQAARSPEATALRAPERATPLTYSELASHIDQVCRFLRQQGIGRQDAVAVVLPNGPEMATAFVSIASACVCAPLNPNYRESEFQFYFDDLKVKGLVLLSGSSSPARAVAELTGVPIFELVSTLESPAGTFSLCCDQPGHPIPEEAALPAHVALVLHTSGTTARPKIVPLSQGNLCQSANNIRRTLQLTPGDRCLNVMPLFHIHGLIGALLSSLSAGAGVVCCPPFDAERFFEWFETIDPTWFSAVPTIHQAILAQIDRSGKSPAKSSLRLIRSSSASLPPAVMERLELAFGVPVLESYGMTEATHQMASNPLPPRERKPGSVGLPAGPDMGIMNDSGELLQADTIGEIVIRGPNVTAGYANNPAANATAFTNGWFRTGDQGWRDADGYYRLTGRLKELINRGGEKVAPREVDDVLLEFPGIAQAVTFAVPHARLGEDVAAAVVLRNGAAVTEKELRDFAISRLAACKVPSRVVFVNEIPKGGTGKVQRIGLHEKLQHLLTADYVEPRNDAETALARMWRELHQCERIGVHDNFFSLGGDSLLAGRLVSRIAADFDIDFPLSEIFQAPTIGEQAVRVEQRLIDQIVEEGE